jgi:dGTPase
LILPDDIRDGVAILKQITRNHILSTAPLAAQQRGQERILNELFEDLYESKASKYLPRKFAYLFDPRSAPDHPSKSRLIADCICSLTETETIALHARLRGHASGSVLDPIVR